MNNVDKLKQRLIDVYYGLEQSMIDDSIDERTNVSTGVRVKGLLIKSNQIKFIKSRRTKLVTNTAITVTQHDTMK